MQRDATVHSVIQGLWLLSETLWILWDVPEAVAQAHLRAAAQRIRWLWLHRPALVPAEPWGRVCSPLPTFGLHGQILSYITCTSWEQFNGKLDKPYTKNRLQDVISISFKAPRKTDLWEGLWAELLHPTTPAIYQLQQTTLESGFSDFPHNILAMEWR